MLVSRSFKFNSRFSYNAQSIIDPQGRLWRKSDFLYQLVSEINGTPVPSLRSVVNNSVFITRYGELIRITERKVEEIRTPGPVKLALPIHDRSIDILLENGDYYRDIVGDYTLHSRGVTVMWRSGTTTMLINDRNHLINTSSGQVTDSLNVTSRITAVDGNTILLNERTLIRLHPIFMSVNEELVHHASIMKDIRTGTIQYPIMILTSDSWLYFYDQELNSLRNVQRICPEIDNYCVVELLSRTTLHEDALVCFIVSTGEVCSIRQIDGRYRVVKSDIPVECVSV